MRSGASPSLGIAGVTPGPSPSSGGRGRRRRPAVGAGGGVLLREVRRCGSAGCSDSSATALARSSISSALASMRSKALRAPSARRRPAEDISFTLDWVFATAAFALMVSFRAFSSSMSATSLSCICAHLVGVVLGALVGHASAPSARPTSSCFFARNTRASRLVAGGERLAGQVLVLLHLGLVIVDEASCSGLPRP